MTGKAVDTESWTNKSRRNVERQRRTGSNDQCAEVEEQFGNNHRVYKRINEISGRKSGCIGSGCIKAKDGKMLVEKHTILNRWTEYVEELFHDVRGSMPSF